jgi:hypothetical protein
MPKAWCIAIVFQDIADPRATGVRLPAVDVTTIASGVIKSAAFRMAMWPRRPQLPPSLWSVASNQCWRLKVTFRNNQSRLRRGRGAQNISGVRRMALNLSNFHRAQDGSTETAASGAGTVWQAGIAAACRKSPRVHWHLTSGEERRHHDLPDW